MIVLKTDVFAAWLRSLRDQKAKARILVRIDALSIGHMGDSKNLGGGLSEMRIDVGPGYRLYFTRRGPSVYLLLMGGDKGSQSRDIARAREMIQEL